MPIRFKRILIWLGWIALAAALVLVAMMVIVTVWPSFGAQGADWLRSVIGDEPVARLEMQIFQIQDSLQKWQYDLSGSKQAAPWGITASPEPVLSPTAAIQPSVTPLPTLPAVQPQGATPVPTATPLPVTWPPAALSQLGSLEGEGVWSPYIQDSSGQTVAYRTYLQPDPNRLYAVVAVVAFDLTRTRLHFVLGYEEPYSPNAAPRSGEMPAADKAPGFLLAMFNGGFKARHGEFGAMADGVTALPARDGLGTLVIYQDGRVRIGTWGTQILRTPDMLAWRQNGPLVIDGGAINPRVYDNSPQDWGYTVTDVSPTLRSGVGLSADGKTFYYFCGPGLTMDAMARSMQATGVDASIQLDINPYWVNFVAVRANGTKLALDALLPRQMKENLNRYLGPYPRDFFYVTGLR